MYKSINEMLTLAEKEGVNLSEIIIRNEMRHSEISREELMEAMRVRTEVMRSSSTKALDTQTCERNNLISGIAKTQQDYFKSEKETICGDFINSVMARALSSSEVNASMGLICAMPTAGSCGIVPAVVISVAEKIKANDEQLRLAMITASGLGAVVTEKATVAGAEGGCQAECGVAAAMAAAACVELYGGTPRQAVKAFTISLMNILGLVCDPVGGLVQVPCAHRNASQSVNAMLSADLALAGVDSYIDADEAVDAMYKIGKSLPVELRETALGGLAATESGHLIVTKMRDRDAKNDTLGVCPSACNCGIKKI